jgi:manganese efflux pump family protein
MMAAVILLGLVLGLDSFRLSLGLGMFKPSTGRQIAQALAFGLCDGLALLVGLAFGRALMDVFNPWVKYVGPVAVALYGLYLVRVARDHEGTEWNAQWMMFGLPLCLSLDNMVAGAGLGMFDYPVLLSPVIIGLLSGLMSFVGLWLGHAIGNRLPFKAELVGGVTLLVLSAILAADTR